MYIPSFKLISQSMLKKSPENADGRTDRRTDGRTLPRHNTPRFSNGRIKHGELYKVVPKLTRESIMYDIAIAQRKMDPFWIRRARFWFNWCVFILKLPRFTFTQAWDLRYSATVHLDTNALVDSYPCGTRQGDSSMTFTSLTTIDWLAYSIS